MKKLTLVLVAVFIFTFATGALANDSVGVGFEFGTNFIVDTDGETGASEVFNLNFDLSDDLAVGYYHEETSGDIASVDINAIQVRNNINDLLDAGVRFGNADSNVYGGIFSSATLISNDSDTYSGDINLNLGYDFLPDENEDFVKLGLSALIKF